MKAFSKKIKKSIVELICGINLKTWFQYYNSLLQHIYIKQLIPQDETTTIQFKIWSREACKIRVEFADKFIIPDTAVKIQYNMGLPINIKDLIHGHSVEWERLEFKHGWNSEEVIYTMCAFANDLNNWGGGYIVIGIQADNGIHVLPPLEMQHISWIIFKMKSRTWETRFNRHILVLWCPAGDFRPYSATSTLGDKAQRQYYTVGVKYDCSTK